MPSNPQSVLQSYRHAVKNHRGPVVIFEHRLMYELEFEHNQKIESADPFGSRIDRPGKDVTIVATSIMALEASRAAEYLSKKGIEVEVIDLHSISNPNHELIFNSVKKTGRLLVADTSWIPYGVAAEISRIIAEKDPSVLKKPIKSLGMQPAPCPTAKALEDLYYPDVRDIVSDVASLLDKDIELSLIHI